MIMIIEEIYIVLFYLEKYVQGAFSYVKQLRLEWWKLYINYKNFTRFIENFSRNWREKEEAPLSFAIIRILETHRSNYEREKEEVGKTDIVEALGFVVAPQ